MLGVVSLDDVMSSATIGARPNIRGSVITADLPARRRRGIRNVSHLGLRRCLVGVMGLHARNDERSECLDGASGSAGFEAFFRGQYRVVVRLAQRVLGAFEGAQDVAQDVFLAAYRRFPGD